MMPHLDPHINQRELEVQGIFYLQKISNRLPNAFINKESDEATYPDF